MEEEVKKSQAISFIDMLKIYLTKINTYFALIATGAIIFLSSFMVWHKVEFDACDAYKTETKQKTCPKFVNEGSLSQAYNGTNLNTNEFDGKEDEKADFGGITNIFGGTLIAFAGILIAVGSANVLYKFAKGELENYLNAGIFVGTGVAIFSSIVQIVFRKGSFSSAEDFDKIEKYMEFSYGFGLYLLIFASLIAVFLVWYANKMNYLVKPNFENIKSDLLKVAFYVKEKIQEMKEKAEKNMKESDERKEEKKKENRK